MTPADYKREARATAREIGMCADCLKRLATPGGSYCGACLEARAERQADRKARFVAAGRCSRCGQPKHDRWRMCGKCRAYARMVKKVAA